MLILKNTEEKAGVMKMETDRVLKSIIITIGVLGLLALIIGLFFADNILTWIIGIVAGSLVSMSKVFLLYRTLNKAVDMDPKAAGSFARAKYTLRLVLSIALVVLAFRFSAYIDPVGVIIGLLLVQPAVYILNFIKVKQ